MAFCSDPTRQFFTFLYSLSKIYINLINFEIILHNYKNWLLLQNVWNNHYEIFIVLFIHLFWFILCNLFFANISHQYWRHRNFRWKKIQWFKLYRRFLSGMLFDFHFSVCLQAWFKWRALLLIVENKKINNRIQNYILK